MKALVVFAHPEPAFFSGALKDVAVETLSALGHAAARAAYLAGYADRLRAIGQAEPLFFHPWSDYDETQRLKPGVVARSGVQWNPRAGQSFGQSAQDFKDGGAPPSEL